MAVLSIVESMRLAEKHGVRFAPYSFVENEKGLEHACGKIGFPVAMKIVSGKISHKTDVGGVVLNIGNIPDARRAFGRLGKLQGFEGVVVQKMLKGKEIIIGGKQDEQFGPTILFGLGGIFVEVFRDYSIRICPITRRDAREMVREIKSFRLLEGYRGKAGVNIGAVEKELLKVSKMMMRERRIKELDFNPLMATKEGVVAVDARVVV